MMAEARAAAALGSVAATAPRRASDAAALAVRFHLRPDPRDSPLVAVRLSWGTGEPTRCWTRPASTGCGPVVALSHPSPSTYLDPRACNDTNTGSGP